MIVCSAFGTNKWWCGVYRVARGRMEQCECEVQCITNQSWDAGCAKRKVQFVCMCGCLDWIELQNQDIILGRWMNERVLWFEMHWILHYVTFRVLLNTRWRLDERTNRRWSLIYDRWSMKYTLHTIHWIFFMGRTEHYWIFVIHHFVWVELFDLMWFVEATADHEISCRSCHVYRALDNMSCHIASLWCYMYDWFIRM